MSAMPFDQIDRNKDGIVTKEEFISAMGGRAAMAPSRLMLAPSRTVLPSPPQPSQRVMVLERPVIVNRISVVNRPIFFERPAPPQPQRPSPPQPKPSITEHVTQVTEQAYDHDFPYHDAAFGPSWRYHYPDSLDEQMLANPVGLRHADFQPNPLQILRHTAYQQAISSEAFGHTGHHGGFGHGPYLDAGVPGGPGGVAGSSSSRTSPGIEQGRNGDYVAGDLNPAMGGRGGYGAYGSPGDLNPANGGRGGYGAYVSPANESGGWHSAFDGSSNSNDSTAFVVEGVLGDVNYGGKWFRRPAARRVREPEAIVL